MAVGDRIVSFGDLPFAYALAGFFSSFQVYTDPLSHFGFIALFGSVVAAVLTIIEPVERTIGFFLIRHFRERAIINLPGTHTSGPAPTVIVAPNSAFGLAPITAQVWNSTVVSYWKNRITVQVYTLSFFLAVTFAFSFPNPTILSSFNVNSSTALVFGVFMLIGSMWIGAVLVQQLRALPAHIMVADIYMMKVEGTLPAGNNFDNLETALRENDWVTARYWARRSHLEGDFNPSP